MASDVARIFGVERADWPLAATGCVLAIGLSVTAGAMILRDERRPLVSGADHLALFSKPAQLHDERMRASTLPPLPEVKPIVLAQPRPISTAPRTIDFVPTASIISPPATAPTPVLPPPTPAYVLKEASRGRAVFLGPAGELIAKKGDVVAGLGRVAAIVFDRGEWTVKLDGVRKSRR